MSVDLPAPPVLLNAAYTDNTKRPLLDVAMTPEALTSFYKEALGKAGWKPTTEKPVQIDFYDMMFFRNEAKDIAILRMHKFEGKLRVNLEHQTAAEFDEETRLAKADQAKRKAVSAQYAKEAAEKNAKDRVIVAIAVPEGAKELKRTKTALEFKLRAGNAKTAVEAIYATLVKGGWKAKKPIFGPLTGSVSLEKKAGVSLVIVYVDAGLSDGEITITSFGRTLSSRKRKPAVMTEFTAKAHRAEDIVEGASAIGRDVPAYRRDNRVPLMIELGQQFPLRRQPDTRSRSVAGISPPSAVSQQARPLPGRLRDQGRE